MDNATLNGHLNSLGTAGTVNVSFEYGPTLGYGSVTTIQALTTASNFSFNISGLSPATTYYFRALADGGIHGSAYGDNLTFNTLNVTFPGVTTFAAANTGYDEVTLNGHLDALGTASRVKVSFEYGTTAGYGSVSAVREMTAADNFSINVTGLVPATLYYFRAKADGDIHGSAYGGNQTFTTSTAIAPEVVTSYATGIRNDNVTLVGRLDSRGTAYAVNVYFKYGPTTAYGSATTPQILTAEDNFSVNVLGLVPGTTYHFQAFADGGIYGVDNGTDLTFTTLSTPIVTSGPASNITFNSVTLSGYLASLGTAGSVSVFFEYGTSDKYGSATPVQTLISSGTGAFNAGLSNLDPGTTYHFRASAYGNNNGSAFGTDMTFTTLTPPTVSTNAAAGITLNAATLNGNLDSLGTSTTISTYFEYGTTTAYGTGTLIQPMTAPGVFNAKLSNLSAGTTYHYRARANGDINGAAAGEDMTFTTLSIAPVVSTFPAYGITTVGAIAEGNLGSLGTAAAVDVSFEYGTTTLYGSSTEAQTLTTGGLFIAELKGLSPGTTYHYRAKADGGIQGAAYGGDMTFTTGVAAPEVETLAVSFIAANSATLNGYLNSLGTASEVNVFFDYGTTTGYGLKTSVQSISVPGEFNITVNGLTPGTT